MAGSAAGFDDQVCSPLTVSWEESDAWATQGEYGCRSVYVDLKKRLAEEYARTHQIDPDYKSEFVAKVLELEKGKERENTYRD